MDSTLIHNSFQAAALHDSLTSGVVFLNIWTKLRSIMKKLSIGFMMYEHLAYCHKSALMFWESIYGSKSLIEVVLHNILFETSFMKSRKELWDEDEMDWRYVLMPSSRM
jgi:hypothetical protein